MGVHVQGRVPTREGETASSGMHATPTPPGGPPHPPTADGACALRRVGPSIGAPPAARHIMEDFLVRLSTRAGAFAFLDLPSRIEVLALASISCCLLGNLAIAFPLAENLALALLALLAIRNRSEVQLIALCGFCAFTTITDIVFMCTYASGWGGTMTALNVFLKLSIAVQAHKLSSALGALDDQFGGMAAVPQGGGGGGGYPTAGYVAPSGPPDVEYADDVPAPPGAGGEGEVTRYRAI